uniref:Uncharacterized protein n=1 Tax=Anguilla anguilla TaxID=7936 RepID=A0A0E9TRZ9_ANGAN
MLIMDSLLHRASSKGRLWRLGLSFRYSSSRFSSVPISSGRCCRRFSPRPRWVRLVR